MTIHQPNWAGMDAAFTGLRNKCTAGNCHLARGEFDFLLDRLMQLKREMRRCVNEPDAPATGALPARYTEAS